MPIPAAKSADEFGTCHDCGVHACPLHGERPGRYFTCSDCHTNNFARRAANPPGDDPDATPRQARWLVRVDRFGVAQFLAEAPGTALNGLEIYEPELVGPMRAGLRAWALTPTEWLLDRLETQLTDQLTDQPDLAATALGLPAEQQGAIAAVSSTVTDEETQNVVRDMAMARVGMLLEEIATATADDRRGTFAANVSTARAAYALAVLSSAVAARADVGSPDISVLAIPGGLLMPPFVVLLSLLLSLDERRRPTASAAGELLTT
jgi:hypothetical protein